MKRDCGCRKADYPPTRRMSIPKKMLLAGGLVTVTMAWTSFSALTPAPVESVQFIDAEHVEIVTTGNINALYRLEFSSDSVNWEEHGTLAFVSNTVAVGFEGGFDTIQVSCYPSTGLSGSVDRVVATFPMADAPQTIIFTDAVPANVSQAFWRFTAQTSDGAPPSPE